MERLEKKDELLLQSKGISQEELYEQWRLFKEGIPPVELDRAAVIGDGILAFTDEEKAKYAAIYQKKKKGVKVLKFVPASGAATRMFKSLFAFKDEFDPSSETFFEYLSRTKNKEVEVFFSKFSDFAFYPFWQQYEKTHSAQLDELSEDARKKEIVRVLLEDEHFNYGNLPKGLLPFHRHSEKVVTAFEEHFREAVMYASDTESAHLHFTISEQHSQSFAKELKAIQGELEKRYDIKFDVSFSFQKPSTDTVSVTPENTFFRDEKGDLLFRPSGHGALLSNLNEQDVDILFVKNIDNVVVKKYTDETVFYKEVLAGKLREVQTHNFRILKRIDEDRIKKRELPLLLDYLKSINIFVPEYLYKFKRRYVLEFVREKLNRPIRVCGMVRNEGEPGGGPFWVRRPDGSVSLQIVESAQVDLSNQHQIDIFTSSTHFNPVDLVCGIKDYRGKRFDLHRYVDTSQAFISSKTYQGKPLKALERPGLWNGSMADWITLFVEVPLITFNPVKTINDLLKTTHQG